jgi:hypothetical protein
MRFHNVITALVLVTAGWGAAQAAPDGSVRRGGKIAQTSDMKAPGEGAFKATEAGQRRYELTFSGQQLRSRKQVERYLLYRAASLARQGGYSWFVFLHLPGEGGPEDHPVRSDATIAAPYGHWQPHWTYRQRGMGWQPWHPEWSTPFWSEVVSSKDVDQYEAHVMIEVGRGEKPSGEPTAFDAAKVLSDLERAPSK